MTRHSPTKFDAALKLGFQGIDNEYTSRVRLQPYHSVIAEALDSNLFHKLRTKWSFQPVSARAFSQSCHLSISIEMQLKAHSYDQILKNVMDSVAQQQVAAFRERCTKLYDKDAAAPETTVRGAIKETMSVTQEVAPTTPKFASCFQIDPSWRQDIESVFESHASRNVLPFPRFVEACRSLYISGLLSSRPLPEAALSSIALSVSNAATSLVDIKDKDFDAEVALAAAFFVELDADHSGGVDRNEFITGLWILTRATEEERMRFAFDKLDQNKSGKLERRDVAESMERQLNLARQISPLIVRQQLRRNGAHGADEYLYGGRGQSMGSVAMEAANCAFNEWRLQIDVAVDALFSEAVLDDGGCVTLEEWRKLWKRSRSITENPA